MLSVNVSKTCWVAGGKKCHEAVLLLWEEEEKAEALSCSLSLGKQSVYDRRHTSLVLIQTRF